MNWLHGHNLSTANKRNGTRVSGQGLSCTTYSFVNSGWVSISVQDSWRNSQLWFEVGRPCHYYYVKSWKETLVHETAEKSRHFSGWPFVLLSGSCMTCSRICELMLTDEPYKGTDKTTWRLQRRAVQVILATYNMRKHVMHVTFCH